MIEAGLCALAPFLALATTLVFEYRNGSALFATSSLWAHKPPLYYYMLLMREREWEQIDIVTNGHEGNSVNPVVPTLLAKKESGELPSNVNIHTVSLLWCRR